MPEGADAYARSPEGPGIWLQGAQQAAPTGPVRRLARRAAASWRHSSAGRRSITRQFHLLYYESGPSTWRNTSWRGVPIAKFTTDLWVYQELVHELRPDLIVETGTFNGGSALYFADLLELAGRGEVVSIDLDGDTDYPSHDRITYLSGASSVSPEVVEEVHRRASGAEVVLVVLDSDHRAAHVRAELDAYHDLVTPGSYLVVEDTSVNGHPTVPDFGPGPTEALRGFLAAHPEFEVDRGREKFLVSEHAGGWLRRRPG